MRTLGKLMAAAGTAALLGGCMHHGNAMPYPSSAGDVAIDSLSASRTAVLRVQNDYPSEVRVYTLIGGQENYVAKAMPNQVNTMLLDPQLFPNGSISFVAKAKDGSASKTFGPYRVERGQTVEIVVPTMFENAHAMIHKSMP